MANYILPELEFDYGALEPHISARIMELHHAKHHAAYVTSICRASVPSGRSPPLGVRHCQKTEWSMCPDRLNAR